MFARTKLLVALLSVVLVSAAVWVGYAVAGAPVDANTPITMTKGMYADLLCMAASGFDPYMGGTQFTYDPATDTVRVTFIAPSQASTASDPIKFLQNRKHDAKERADLRMKLLLPKIQAHVSPAV
ncbi:MAG: hypothetical protein NTZ09_11700, partial [Candidatus Hydrogenedentes bacterium]|nr:hypothetical protein [Candidatus Hydrogenedentota bacterium]